MRISKHGLWSLICIKTSDIARWNLEALPDDERQRIEELLERLLINLRTERDIDRLVKTLSEVANGSATETLERVTMRL